MIVKMPFFSSSSSSSSFFFFMMMMMGNVFKARHFGPTPCWMVLPTRTVHWVIPGLDTRTLREHTPRPSNQANPVWA